MHEQYLHFSQDRPYTPLKIMDLCTIVISQSKGEQIVKDQFISERESVFGTLK